MDSQPDRDKVNVGVRMDRRLYERFVVAARSNHRPPTAEIRRLIDDRVREYDAETAEEVAA